MILNTKNFDDGYKATKTPMSQRAILKESGFSTAAAEVSKPDQEPASYTIHNSQGAANFTYSRNPHVDKVTKTDKEIKMQGQEKMRYNIVTGSLQSWF